MVIQSYRDLIVWQKGLLLVTEIYALTEQFPKTETYGSAAQMRRAAVSIPSNIAEGRRRGSRLDFRHFLLNAVGSGAELETQIEICKRLPFGKTSNFDSVDAPLDEIMRMLSRMIAGLKATSS